MSEMSSTGRGSSSTGAGVTRTGAQTSGMGGSGAHGSGAQGSGMGGQTAQQMKDQASGLMDSAMESAKSAASGAQTKLMEAVEGQKTAGAELVGSMAGAMRRAAGEFENDIPMAGQYIRRAADQIDSFSNAMKQRDVGDMLSSVQDFAKRQPTAFLGVTFLAGFALVRFLKSSANAQGGMSGGQSHSGAGRNFGSPGHPDHHRSGSTVGGTAISSGQGMGAASPPTYGQSIPSQSQGGHSGSHTGSGQTRSTTGQFGSA